MIPRPSVPHIHRCHKMWRVYYVKAGRVRYVSAATFEYACVMAWFYR
jgi:hypothetical protein